MAGTSRDIDDRAGCQSAWSHASIVSRCKASRHTVASGHNQPDLKGGAHVMCANQPVNRRE
jgi:hypothetical protein